VIAFVVLALCGLSDWHIFDDNYLLGNWQAWLILFDTWVTGGLLKFMVANGASELLIEVFEERGAHARSALGVSQIPFGCCVEIEMVVETCVSESECAL